MQNPFKKLFGKPKAVVAVSMENPVEEQMEEEVETTYDNHGDYYEFIATKGGQEIKRKRAESHPDDKESITREYKQFKKEVGAIEESDLNLNM